MQQVTIKKKFPWKTALLIIILVVVIIAFAGYAIPTLGATLWGGFTGFWIATYNFFAPSTLQILAALGIVGGLAFLVYYRRKYGAKKMLMQTRTTLPAQDTLAQPVFGSDTEVKTG